MNDSREAAAALLMLSTGYFRNTPTPRIYEDSDDESMELPTDLTYRPQPMSRQPFKRQLSPNNQCDNKRRRYMPPDHDNFHVTPKSTINPLLPAASFFLPINPKRAHFDENMEHNYAALNHKGGMYSPRENLASVSPTTSEASSLMDEVSVNFSTTSVVQPWTDGDLMRGLNEEVRFELERMQHDSRFAKEAYTREQAEASPIEFDYHPNKSHRNYPEHFDVEGRAKNNLASRRSRHKKKQIWQMKSFHLEFDRTENRQLYAQEHWMADTIAALEAKILDQGYDLDELKALRLRCGLK